MWNVNAYFSIDLNVGATVDDDEMMKHTATRLLCEKQMLVCFDSCWYACEWGEWKCHSSNSLNEFHNLAFQHLFTAFWHVFALSRFLFRSTFDFGPIRDFLLLLHHSWTIFDWKTLLVHRPKVQFFLPYSSLPVLRVCVWCLSNWKSHLLSAKIPFSWCLSDCLRSNIDGIDHCDRWPHGIKCLGESPRSRC